MRVLTTNKLRYNQNSNCFGHIITYKYPISDGKTYILQKMKGQDWVHKPFFSLVIHETTIFLWFSEKNIFSSFHIFYGGFIFIQKDPISDRYPISDGALITIYSFTIGYLWFVCYSLGVICFIFHVVTYSSTIFHVVDNL